MHFDSGKAKLATYKVMNFYHALSLLLVSAACICLCNVQRAFFKIDGVPFTLGFWKHLLIAIWLKGRTLMILSTHLSQFRSKIFRSALHSLNRVTTAAIIGDGDRQFWEPRAPMIWDNFFIFRTNCAIFTSYIRSDPRTCRGRSRRCCHVSWSEWWQWRDSLADFSQRWQGIRKGMRSRVLHVVLCPELMEN